MSSSATSPDVEGFRAFECPDCERIMPGPDDCLALVVECPDCAAYRSYKPRRRAIADGGTDGLEEWPTPSFDRPDILYYCESCGDHVVPVRGDAQAAVLLAGRTTKLCEDCARTVLDDVRTGVRE